MVFSLDELDWNRDGLDWPNRDHSRFVLAQRVRFHVQVAGTGPVCLLLHGVGASAHSWRDLVPELSRHFTLVRPDLPGHGFSSMPSADRVSRASYAGLVASLLEELALKPDLVVGHSAGAAIASEMVLQDLVDPAAIVSFNGAFVPMGGIGDRFFSPLARVLSFNPLMPRLFAWRATSHGTVEGLLTGTGSTLTHEGVEWYRRLMSSPGHCSAALQMMARWSLEDMPDAIRSLHHPLLLVHGENDKAIPLRDTELIARNARDARLEIMAGTGHLAHEEQPDHSAGIIVQAWQQHRRQSATPRQTRETATC